MENIFSERVRSFQYRRENIVNVTGRRETNITLEPFSLFLNKFAFRRNTIRNLSSLDVSYTCITINDDTDNFYRPRRVQPIAFYIAQLIIIVIYVLEKENNVRTIFIAWYTQFLTSSPRVSGNFWFVQIVTTQPYGKITNK